MNQTESPSLPNAFFWRRLHSLTGVFLVLFICEHLLTNSQAALLFGQDGNGFVRMVNLIHSLPYLPAIEIFLLAVPILVHGIWGVRYLFTSEANSASSEGNRPSLHYPLNRAYTWQRITSWLLLLGIAGHVVQMRFVKYPSESHYQGGHQYMVRLSLDEGLYTVADRLGVTLFDEVAVAAFIQGSEEQMEGAPFSSQGESRTLDLALANRLVSQQEASQREGYGEALQAWPLGEQQVVAVAEDAGTAMLLTIRDTMKSPLMASLYSIFVLGACFHAFNGLWTASITWGIAVTEVSQRKLRTLVTAAMVAVAALGLAAIWGTYWINLYQ